MSPFEAPGPNLIHAKDRLTHDFYLRWMRKPKGLAELATVESPPHDVTIVATGGLT